jgi:hypothetical protein
MVKGLREALLFHFPGDINMKRILIVAGIIILSACSGMGRQYGSSGNSYSGASSGMTGGSSGPRVTSQFFDPRHESPSDPYFGG